MRISVIGCGYLGAVHAASMTSLGHDVVGIDVDPFKVAALSTGHSPFYEPGLDDLLTAALQTGRLRFSTDLADASGSRVHFVAVGTPQKPGENAADLRYVDAAIDGLIPMLATGDLVVGKSTVPVGTARRLAARVAASGSGAIVAWNPEFLREGFAIADTLHPDRLVYGVPDGDHDAGGAPGHAQTLLDELYGAALADGTPLIVTDYETAELVKVSANAFLATKISFINAMAEVCEAAGGDVLQLADAIGHDARIGRRFLGAGIGFGGGCLPKDIRAFMARAGELGADQALTFLREVDEINLRRREKAVDIARDVLGGTLQGRRIAVLGLAFKPDSDDVRDSPALDIAGQLALQGATVLCHDPRAIGNARSRFPSLDYVETVAEAVAGAEAVLVLTEWGVYRDLDPAGLRVGTATPVVIDGRNCLDPERWRAAGWRYRALGRPRQDRQPAEVALAGR